MSLATISSAISSDARTSLNQAFQAFRSVLEVDEQAKLDSLISSTAAPTAASVLALTNDIEQTNAGRQSRRVSARLQTFLDGIQQFTSVVDGFLGPGPSVAETIWGVVKVALLLTSNANSYFGQLTEVLKTIGDQCPRYQDYAALFQGSKQLQITLCVYFGHVIRLCRQAVQVGRKPTPLRLVHTALSPFSAHFGPVMKDLADASKRVSEEVMLASVRLQVEEAELNKNGRMELSQSRRLLATFSSSAQREFAMLQSRWEDYEARQKKRVILKIKANLSQVDHVRAWRQVHKQTTAGTAEWFQTTMSFEWWREYPGSAALSISGDLGCGKSVLAANIVPYLISSSIKNTLVTHFFCRHNVQASVKADVVIGSILGQIVDARLADMALGDLDLLDAVTSKHEHIDNLDIITAHLNPDIEYFVVLDNLDYCENDQAEAILDALHYLHEKGTFKIILPARYAMRPVVKARFPDSHLMHMRPPAIDADIHAFVETSLADKLEHGRLQLGNITLVAQIRDYIVAGAESMFLWAFLMLEEIAACQSDESIVEVLQKPPKELAIMFKDMFLQACRSSEYDFMRNIFAWTLGAKRDLTVSELGQALSLQRLQRQLPTTLDSRVVTAAISSARGLISLDEDESTVRLVHHSFGQFLLGEDRQVEPSEAHFEETELHAELAELCFTFLKLDVFTLPLAKKPGSDQSAVLQNTLSSAAQSAIRATGSTTALSVLKGRHYLDRVSSRSSSPAHEQTVQDLNRRLAGIISEMAVSANEAVSVSEYPFLEYARTFWYAHAAVLNSESHKSAMDLLRFLVRARYTHYDQPWHREGIEAPANWLGWSRFFDDEQVRVLYWSWKHSNPAITWVTLDYISVLKRGREFPSMQSEGVLLDLCKKTLLRPPKRQMADAICSCWHFWYPSNFSEVSTRLRALLAVRFDMAQHLDSFPSHCLWLPGQFYLPSFPGTSLKRDQALFDTAVRGLTDELPQRLVQHHQLDKFEDSLHTYVRSYVNQGFSLLQLSIIYKSRSLHTMLIKHYDHSRIVQDAAFTAIHCEDHEFLNNLRTWMSDSEYWEVASLHPGLIALALRAGRLDFAAMLADMVIDVPTEPIDGTLLCAAIATAAAVESLVVFEPLLRLLQGLYPQSSNTIFESIKEMDDTMDILISECNEPIRQAMSHLWDEFKRQSTPLEPADIACKTPIEAADTA